MGAVPFGVAYFPIGWKDVSSASFDEDDRESQDDGIEGSFPLPAKAALGIRMCLFSTLVGQLAMTFTSTFSNPVVFQLVENVPFYHALARIVITEQGYGIDSLTTLFFLFGLGSVLVGLSFYLVGKFRLGRIVYFFPSHVLLGCIAGIAVFVIKTAVEVTISTTVSYDLDGLLKFMDKWHHFAIVVCFEVVLRVLAAVLTGPRGEPRFPLLSPIYFCSIIPVFYLALKILDVDLDRARAEGYFLPDPVASCGFSDCEPTTFYDRVFDGHIWDIFTIPLNFKAISWTAVGKSVGTLVSMAAFSFLQVPIMIPAFAVSSNVEIDMDAELIAHGWSNGLSGLFGGLQNVMTYSISILYHKSGGYGKASSLAIIALTGAMFVIGPAMAAFIPRAMAGTLLLHIGVDLLLEGVYDTFGVYDALEYSGIWLITLVMSSMGMTAGLVAGVISALSTYTVQSITALDPIFTITAATTLRGSVWLRSSEASEFLRDPLKGRARVFVVQLQGHLFFGNSVGFSEAIKEALATKRGTELQPIVAILDFSMVVGMDSSAAQAIVKLKDAMRRVYQVKAVLFVIGSHREDFPCEYELSRELSMSDLDDMSETAALLQTANHSGNVTSLGISSSNHIYSSFDEALIFAEDFLIARSDPKLWLKELQIPRDCFDENEDTQRLTLSEERLLAEKYVGMLVPSDDSLKVRESVSLIMTKLTREEFGEGCFLWHEGDKSTSLKLLLSGKLVAYLDGTGVSEVICKGNLLGELGLVHGSLRLSTVKTASPRVVLYSLDIDSWGDIKQNHPAAARVIDLITIRYLAHRVQHVSNRIFETRCLPV